MIGSALDKAIGVVAPGWAARRMAARATMDQINAFSNTLGGYTGGKTSRLTKGWQGANVSENAISQGQIAITRGRAWDLYRNTPEGRKMVRSLCAKVIGRGLHPLSLATTPDGEPHEAFRERLQKVWRTLACDIDYRGRPGQGGMSFPQMCKLALRSVILSGEVLYRLRKLSPAEQMERDSTVPLALQLIHADRLDVNKQGDGIYRGIELNKNGTRRGYWILDQHPSESPLFGSAVDSRFVKAAEIFHLYVSDDIDQLRGVTWTAPAITQMKDTADYQYNELRAAAVGACVVMGIRRPTGAPTRLGVNVPTGDLTTDDDDNPITSMQPGMIFNLGADGALEGFNPGRPATNAEAWISRMLRSTAAAIPGMKSSTITGDYRNSSFSSERSADNDSWPEIEDVQDWFAEGFCQPIFERLVTEAVAFGLFDGVVTAEEFENDSSRFLASEWQGPVARSINPTDDAKASDLEIEAGTSSLQVECAKRGRDWRQLLRDKASAYEYAKALGLPEPLILQTIGMTNNVLSTVSAPAGEKEGASASEA